MAIHTDCLNVIIPIENIERCGVAGGLSGVLSYEKDRGNKAIRCDDFLYRDGSMGSHDVEVIITYWHKMGLEPVEVDVDGNESWKDLCVVDMFGGPTLPCNWIEFEWLKERSITYVYMKGKPKGRLVSSVKSLNGLEL